MLIVKRRFYFYHHHHHQYMLLLLAGFVTLVSVSTCTVTTQTPTAYIELLGSTRLPLDGFS
jgi:hypothetical protein